MNRTFAVIAVSAALLSTALGRPAAIPLRTLVHDSDLIVIATLSDVANFENVALFRGSGTLLITHVIRGAAAPGEQLRLEWSYPLHIVCPRIDHTPHQGMQMLWLLQRSKDDAVRADYHGRVLPPAHLTRVEALLNERVE